MVTYYGTKPDGGPIYSSNSTSPALFWAWDSAKHKSWWVDDKGKWSSRSHFTPDQSIVKDYWTPTMMVDSDLEMDEGL